MDKSSAKKEYKETDRPMGLYRIRNTRNDKSFVGFSTDLRARINRHKAELRLGSHRTRELQEEWKLFGESSFQFEVLDELSREEDSKVSPTEELGLLLEMWVRKLEGTGCSVVRLS